MARTAQPVAHFSEEVAGENRRLLGITPKLLGSYPESPARMLPRNRGLKALAGATKRKGAAVKVEGL